MRTTYAYERLCALLGGSGGVSSQKWWEWEVGFDVRFYAPGSITTAPSISVLLSPFLPPILNCVCLFVLLKLAAEGLRTWNSVIVVEALGFKF